MEVTANFTNNNFTTPSSVEIITFVSGNAYTADVVVKNTYTGTATTPIGGLFYLHRDYQGTIVAITNATGGLVEKRQFDAWGLLTKVQNGAGVTLTKLTFFDRGYTGHEHLESVGLINMNGRVYDPMLHRFLQADSMVQEPYNTQNYNRYGYCLNNPLKYTDISGEDFGITFAISMGVALAVYFGDALINDRPITFRGIATTVVTTAVSAGISYGIGSAVVGINNLYVRATVQALAHGTAQGTLTAIQGGKFWTGFATGSLSSVMSSLWQGGEHITDRGDFTMKREIINGIGGAEPGSIGTIFFGSISGGAGAAISGGNFWQGAVTGMIVSGLNHTLHDAFDGDPKPKPKPKNNSKHNKKSGKGGQSVGISCNAALGGGIGLEFGFVSDDNGGRALYFTFKGNVGYGSDVGISASKITPTHKGDFSVNHFSGSGNSHSASFLAWGYERGGTMSKNGIDKVKVNNFGTGKNGYTTNTFSRSYITKVIPEKIGLSYMFSESKTWIFKF